MVDLAACGRGARGRELAVTREPLEGEADRHRELLAVGPAPFPRIADVVHDSVPPMASMTPVVHVVGWSVSLSLRDLAIRDLAMQSGHHRGLGAHKRFMLSKVL